MNTAVKIIKYELQDVLRSKWVIGYAILFLLITDFLLRFDGDTSRVILSLMNVNLTVIPLVSIMFGSLYLYTSREFIELLLSQPINRIHLYFGMYAGIAIPLSISIGMGILIPFFYFGSLSVAALKSLFILVGTGISLTLIFLAVSFLITILNDERVKGLGISILIWLFFTIIYDGLVLIIVYVFGEYPLEKAVLSLSILNPIDLGRVLMMLEFDVSALMGYTGAVFQKFFGTVIGVWISLSSMALWTVAPLFLGLRRFKIKDF